MYRFHGRAQELLALERAFRKHPAVVLTGMGGMGKTALAREAAAWWLRTGRFDAAVFCSFESRPGAEQAVRLLGQALDGDAFSARPAADQWARAVELFRTRRVLFIWDNFESTLPIYQQQEESILSFGPDARALLHRLYRDLAQSERGLPAGRLLVTCRPADTGLPGIKETALAGLARPDSLYLLAAILELKDIAADRPGYDRAEIEGLLNTLDDHPLSVELVAPHLKTLTPAAIRADYYKLLNQFADGTAYEARNRSLLASFEFSKKHIGAAARAVLPSLAWFEGGVFEQLFLDFANLEPSAWDPIRAELVATALIQVEDDIEIKINDRPYLRFHPTLAHAARVEDAAAEGPAARFIELYAAVAQMAYDALRGRRPAAGMALVAREELNLRSALARALARGERPAGGAIAATLNVYLDMAGRLRERDALAAWVREKMSAAGGELDAAACEAAWRHALSLADGGHAAEALDGVRALLARLEAEGLAGGADPSFQVALGHRTLGQLYVNANRPDLALAPTREVIARFERLPGDAARGNLAAALGDLASACRALGRPDEALAAAGRALDIARERGDSRNAAVGLVQIAGILLVQQRYAEAEARYGEALAAARQAGDLGLQGAVLQHLGVLLRRQDRPDRAVDLFKQALALFQRAGDPGAEMQTCDLLATAELNLGRLDAAEAWYARSRELAKQLNDHHQFVGVARNLGILYQNKAEQTTNRVTRKSLLDQAVSYVQESLKGFLEMKDKPNAESSYFQLGVLHHKLGDLDQAEAYLKQATEISESLDLPEVYKNYGILALIARTRGDADAAARWQAKCDAKLAELERLRRGGEEQQAAAREQQEDRLAEFVLALAQAAYQARAAGRPLPPDAAEALAQLEQQAPPLAPVAAFLRAVAAGGAVPPLPPALPDKVAALLKALAEALDAGG